MPYCDSNTETNQVSGEIEMKKLKQCPFCGSSATLMCVPYSENPYVVICDDEECKTSVGIFSKSRIEAIEKWNARATGVKEIKQLKQEIEKLQNEVDYYKHEYFSECDLREEKAKSQLTVEELKYLIKRETFTYHNATVPTVIDRSKKIIAKLQKQKEYEKC